MIYFVGGTVFNDVLFHGEKLIRQCKSPPHQGETHKIAFTMSFTCCTGNWMATPSFLIANLKIKINTWRFLEPNILPACCNERDWQGDDDNSVAVHYNWILKVFSMSSEHRRGLTFLSKSCTDLESSFCYWRYYTR